MAGEIEEIKTRLDIIDVIGEYIRLKQAGTNWKALCPFHNEKSPSFMASRDKQIWHCFGCGEGGDVLSFVQKIENLEFIDVLRTLAQKAGVQLQQHDSKASSKRNRLLDVTQLAANFWHKILLESPQAKSAREYLEKRKISQQTIEEFNLGYAPDSWDVTMKFLTDRGFTENEIFFSGLTVKKDRGAGFYDRFRDRIMFPINDIHGSTVGFTARTMKSDEQAKYINTPQTEIYNKSLVVYNIDKAKTEIRKQGLAIMVEGQMDAITSYQAGVQNVVASSGTALTLDQVKILKRFANIIAIAFDTDAAGENAAKRGIDVALGEEIDVKVITLPQGKDPDECIKNNVEDWKSAIKNAKSIMQYYFDQVIERYDLTGVDNKKEAARILLTAISKIGNKIEQTHWLQKLSELLNVSEQVLREALGSKSSSSTKKYSSSQSSQENLSNQSENKPAARTRDEMVMEQILAIILKYKRHLPHLVEILDSDMVTTPDLSSLYKELIVYYTKGTNNTVDNFDYDAFREILVNKNLAHRADTLILLAETQFGDFDHDVLRKELSAMVQLLKKNYYTAQLKQLEGQIRQAEQSNNAQSLAELSQRFNDVVSKLNLLN